MSEELRALLKSTEFGSAAAGGGTTPIRSTGGRSASSGVGQTPLRDLASLLGTLDVDVGTPWDRKGSGAPSSSSSSAKNQSEPSPVDEVDATVLHFGTVCSLRGRLGKYVTAIPSSGGSSEFVVGVDGQGVGDPLDSIVFVNVESREDTGPIRYGATVCLRAPGAKDRLLGVRETSKLGFWRGLVGQGEKWTILKGAQLGRSAEEPNTRGLLVRQGDFILVAAGLIAQPTTPPEHMLSLYEGVSGSELRLVHRDRAGLGTELWQVDLHGALPLPAWAERPYLSGKFLVLPAEKRGGGVDALTRAYPGAANSASLAPAPALSTLPPAEQQRRLVRELLLALTGVEGEYIRIASDGPAAPAPRLRRVKLTIDIGSADRAAALQVATLLPLCEQAIEVREFSRQHSRLSRGLVSHALAAAVKAVLREFDLLVAQLEHQYKEGSLSLQRLVFLLQPAQATVRLLHVIAHRSWDRSGGELIDQLYVLFLEQGDAKAKALCLDLLHRACRPFLSMLSRWIFRGELDDQYGEFMVREDTSVSHEALEDDFNAQYWETRHTLRDSHVPRIFLPIAHRALTAGKYLNVVRGCLASGLEGNLLGRGGVPLELPLPRDMVLDAGTGSALALASVVEEAYQVSSRALLRLLCDGHGLHSHLKSLSRFFLLEHGDFFIQFMDTAEEELRRDVKDVALARIQGLLQLAVQTSTLASDPHREELSCTLASHNLIQHLHLIQSAGLAGQEAERERDAASLAALSSQGLKGVEALTLDYKVAWPVSLLLSRRALTKYQLLSRLLYFSKHVELRVLGSWQDHQQTKQLEVRAAMGQAFCLRHRMLHFLQNFVYYMALEVIGPRAHEMNLGMQAAQDMDEVLGLHERFLDTCLKECLLASQDLLKNLTKIMTTCLLFADQVRRFSESSAVATDPSLTAREGLGRGRASSTNRAMGDALLGEEEPPARPKPSSATSNSREARAARLGAQTAFVRQEAGHESFKRLLNKFADTFDTQLREFLERLWADSYRHHPQLANLCTRLDYNGFFSSSFSSSSSSSS